MMNMYRRVLAGVGFAVLFAAPVVALAQTAPSLGTAESFALLSGSTVTNTGSSIIGGDLGVSPGSAITGFPPGVVSGTTHAADATALAAQAAVTAAYNSLASQACTQDLTGQDLGGMTLTAGVYCFSTTAGLTGTLTLDAQGNSNAVFIFKIGSTLTTASGSSVVVSNGGSPCNVFWQVGSSATLGTTTSFAGNILAQASISLNSGAGVTGRTLARTGAVTLISSSVAAVACMTSPPPPTCPPITLSPAALPNAVQAVAYSQQFTASGGTAPYVFSVTAGALPAGLTLTPAGRLAGLTGTPTVSGLSSFTVRATDANGCFTELPYSMVIAAAPLPPPGCPPIALSPPALPNAVQGVAYSQTITGSGGTAPYVFGVTAGALPAGLTLTAGGVLSGRPNNAGASTFTVRGTDANGCFAEVPYTLTVVSAVPTLPQWITMLLALGLLGLGYLRLRRRQALA